VKHTDSSVIASSGGSVSRLCVTDADILSLAYPVTHIGGPGLLASALRTGASAILVAIFDAERTPHELAAAKVTMLGSAAPFFNAYLAAQEKHGSEKLFPHLRLSVNGGAAAPAELYARVPVELGGKGLFNGYGMTECPVTGYAQFDDHPEELLAAFSGLPAPGVQVRAVDAEGHDRPPGVEGELRLRGPQLFAGYVDSSQDAAALDEKGFFKTGDLGVVNADGSYHVTGRLKDIIIRNAENISAPQMEQVLIGHPHIADVAIVGVPDPRTGERCCAFVVLTPDAGSLELTDIIEFCKSSGVASYKIPEQLEIIDVLPRTAMGKVLKHKLRDLVTSSAP
jgi:cyclohexanecarboxylate-CoA ligase